MIFLFLSSNALLSPLAPTLLWVSVFFGFFADFISWRFAFWSLAVFSSVVLVLSFFIRESTTRDRLEFEWSAFKALGRKQVLSLAVLGALYSLIINSVAEIMNPFFENKFTISTFIAGLYSAVWGLGIILGGVLGGKGTDKLGHRKSWCLLWLYRWGLSCCS